MCVCVCSCKIHVSLNTTKYDVYLNVLYIEYTEEIKKTNNTEYII